jgi:hypothetical protein
MVVVASANFHTALPRSGNPQCLTSASRLSATYCQLARACTTKRRRYSLSPAQLSHEALAEAHHLIVRLALGVKVTATLRTDRKAATTVGVGYSKHTGRLQHQT